MGNYDRDILVTEVKQDTFSLILWTCYQISGLDNKTTSHFLHIHLHSTAAPKTTKTEYFSYTTLQQKKTQQAAKIAPKTAKKQHQKLHNKHQKQQLSVS